MQEIVLSLRADRYSTEHRVKIPTFNLKVFLRFPFRKLLKMHEAKYEPMDKVDAEKIMEEILGMQAGLNPDQQVGEISERMHGAVS